MSNREDCNVTVSKRMRELRRGLDLSQRQFAESLGVSQNVIAKHEAGFCKPSLALVILVSKAYGVTCDWLLGLVNNMHEYWEANIGEVDCFNEHDRKVS